MKRVQTVPEGPRRYEAMFLVESGVASKDWDSVETHMKGILERSGATILSAGKWDERKLAYEIRGARRGTYWLCYFQAPPDAPEKIRRTAVLSETVLRSMVLVMDRAEEVPQDVATRRTTVAIGEDREMR